MGKGREEQRPRPNSSRLIRYFVTKVAAPYDEYWRGIHQSVPEPTERDINLWLLVLATMILDIGLTLIGLQNGLIERNVIALFGMEMVGYAALAFLKVPAILIGLTGWITLPETYRQLNLVGLSLPWIWATIINSWLIITEVSL